MAKHKISKKKIRRFILGALIVVIIAVSVSCYIVSDADSGNDSESPISGVQDIFAGTTTAVSDILRVHFIDVGQGDCIFIEFPDGKNMMIDNGKYKDNGELVFPLIKSHLDKYGVEKINVLLGTHAHADHVGNMKNVFDTYEVDYCMRPFQYYDGKYSNVFDENFNLRSRSSTHAYQSSKTYYYFLKALLDERCRYEFFTKDSDFTQKFTYNGAESSYTVDFLTPTGTVPDFGYKNQNNYSPIMTLEYGGFVFMFTGDAEVETENEFLQNYGSIDNPYPDVDVLKVGHHGSYTSSSINFLNAIKSEYAVIQCGRQNEYHHPSSAALTRLIDAGVNIYRNDLQGDVIFEIGGDGEIKNIKTDMSATTEELHTPGI